LKIMGIERRMWAGYRWHMRCTTMLLTAALLGGCRTARPMEPLEVPSESERHNAALAMVSVVNGTTSQLSIAFRSANPPVQEVMIGRVPARERARLAPVPASEPIVLIARRDDGSELVLEARSFELDVEWTWEIPRGAIFVKPAGK